MVIGSGLIAREFFEFQDDTDVLIFASGVSDSKSQDPSAFFREITLVHEMLSKYTNSLFLYFSTTSIYDNDLAGSPYIQHKTLIESIIQSRAKKYIILRLSQVAGHGGNKSNLINFLFERIKNGEEIDLWSKATRNLIDIKYVYKMIKYILYKKIYINQIVNIASPTNISVNSIIEEIEQIVNKKAIINSIDRGSDVYIDLTDILPLFKQLNLEFSDDYIKNLIRTYY